MQSINGKNTGGKQFLYLSVASSFLAGKLSSVLITSIPLHDFLQIDIFPLLNMDSTSVSASFFGLLLKPISPVPGRCNQSVPYLSIQAFQYLVWPCLLFCRTLFYRELVSRNCPVENRCRSSGSRCLLHRFQYPFLG